MKTCIRTIVLITLWLSGAVWGRAAESPNVLFIAVDDLNDWIGVLGGHPQSMTPNIDKLASRGCLFTNAYCAAPACNPSRVALMTGLRPSTTGIYLNPQPWRPVLPTAVTLPQHFMAHGYRALGSGKIYHGAYPDPASWHTYFPSKTKQKPGDPLPPGRPINGIPKTAHFDWGPVDATVSQMGDAQVVDWVSQQLAKKWDKPFFLACGIYRPHLPWYVPASYFEKFPLASIQLPPVMKDDLGDVPAGGVRMAKPNGDHRRVVNHKQWKKAVQGYLASVAFADDMIGRVMNALDESPQRDNTIVVLWTDHGWHLGEKQHWRKFALWENATRTPLIVIAPGVTKAGTRCSRAVSLLDIYPTLSELCRLKTQANLDGQSLVPLLRDPNALRREPAITTHGRNNHAIRTDRWRYIRYADGGEELYDHKADSNEFTNLASRESHQKIKRELAAWLPKVNASSAPQAKKKRTTTKKKSRKKRTPGTASKSK